MKYLIQSLNTESTWHQLPLRLALGIMIWPHGAQKLLGWFGGYGFSGTMGYFTDTMGIPWIFAFAAIIAEFFGGVGLILGIATRLNAALVGITMIVAMFTSHIQFGFFMNWFGNQKGEGIEFFLLAIGISVSLVLSGGGKFSVDASLKDK